MNFSYVLVTFVGMSHQNIRALRSWSENIGRILHSMPLCMVLMCVVPSRTSHVTAGISIGWALF